MRELVHDAITGEQVYREMRDYNPEKDFDIHRDMKLRLAKNDIQGVLAITDYHVIKSQEPGSSYVVPDEILTQRKKYRQLWNDFEAGINGCKTMADLDVLNFNL
jgi:hypothetical protein